MDTMAQFYAARARVLELIIESDDLHVTLDALCRETEDLNPDFRCSVVLASDDGRFVRHGAAPSMPDFVNEAVDGLEIGPGVASCGAAMFERTPVVVDDIETHPNWEPYREIARNAGIRSCWSHPIVGCNDTVLGSFALYSDAVRTPTDAERELIATQSNLARIAIERLNASARLRASEDRFRDFAEVASDWFWETDADLRFTWFSDRAAEVTGVDQSASIGKRRVDLTVENPESDKWQDHLDDLRYRQPFRRFVYEQRRDDGTPWHCAVSGKPVFDADGTFMGYRGVGMDATDQVTAQETIRAALREAEEANRAKSRFLANMSHDLRTPLNAINGFAEAFVYEVFGAHANPKYTEYAADILASGNYLLAIINDILDFSKIEAGQVTADIIHVDLTDAIGESVKLVDASRPGAAIQTAIAVDAGAVAADPRLLRQAMVNLLSNARKFTPPSGAISVSTARADDASVVIEVRDTGIGMSEKDLALALEPFRQVLDDVQLTREGQGLGLPIAKELVALSDGRFDIASAPGKGTTVRMTFSSPTT